MEGLKALVQSEAKDQSLTGGLVKPQTPVLFMQVGSYTFLGMQLQTHFRPRWSHGTDQPTPEAFVSGGDVMQQHRRSQLYL